LNPFLHRFVRAVDPALAVFIIMIIAALSVLAWGWLPQSPSHEELIAYAGKLSWLKQKFATGEFPSWWIDGYLGGFSGVAVMSYLVSMIPYWALSLVLPEVMAFKVGGLLLLGLGAVSARAFACRLSQCGWTGTAVGVMYLCSAQPLMRLGWQEHMTIITAVPLVPLTFLAMLRVAETGKFWDALLLAVSFSATLLCWSKIGATLAVPLSAFALWLFIARPESRMNLIRGAKWAIPGVLLLGVLPLLPLVREYSYMTVFELGPFAGWQAMYSAKSGMSWFDRGGDLFQNLPQVLRVDRGGYYLGLVQLLAVFLFVMKTWHRWPAVPAGLRPSLALSLGMFWLSFGPRSVIQGHLDLMRGGYQLPDWSISLAWFALIAPAFLFWWMLPATRWRKLWMVLLVATYYFVPGFVWIEKLPLFANLRAPDSFWILNGALLWSVAAGIATVACVRLIPQPAWRGALAASAAVFLVWDSSANTRGFFAQGLPSELYTDFDDTVRFLHDAPPAGRVLAISGRYFYLGIPALADRPLSTEAAHHNFMLRNTALLEQSRFQSIKSLQTYLTIAGISHVLLDRKDPGMDAETGAWFSSWMPKVYEDPYFLVFQNANALFPAFLASHSQLVARPNNEDIVAAAAKGVLLVSDSDALTTPAANKSDGTAPPFERIDGERTSPEHYRFPVSGRSGVIVLSQAWHPDWNVAVDGETRPVLKAAGAFPGVVVADSNTKVEFQFSAPFWYSAVVLGGMACWLIAFLIFGWLGFQTIVGSKHRLSQP